MHFLQRTAEVMLTLVIYEIKNLVNREVVLTREWAYRPTSLKGSQFSTHY